MGKETITLGNIEVEKHKFHQYKSPILINDVDISKIVSNRFHLWGTKMIKKLDPYA